MWHVAKFIHGKFWLLVSWLVIFTAIVLTLVRLFLPLVDIAPYKADVEQIAQKMIGMPVRIGSMHIELHRAHLAMSFQNVDLLDPQTGLTRLHFREARAGIRLLASLINRQLTFKGAMVSGADLRVIRREDGRLIINGFEESTASQGASVAGFFLHSTHLRVVDSRIFWLDEKNQMPALQLSQVNADLINVDERHRLAASMHLGEQGGETVRLAADLREGFGEFNLFGQFYLKTSSLELAQRLGQRVTRGLVVKQGQVDLELWGEVRQSRVHQLSGEVELSNLSLSTTRQDVLELSQLSTHLNWREEPQGWRLALDRLRLERNRVFWPTGRLHIAMQQLVDGGNSFQVGVENLGIKKVSQIVLPILPETSKLQDVLMGLAPGGQLEDFRLAFDRRPSAQDLWRISGRIEQLESTAWKGVPGVSGLDMSFEGDQQGGALLLDSKNLVMDMPGLFREKLSAEDLQGHFNWNYSPELGLSLNTSDLRVSTAHMQTLSRLAVQIPLTGESPVIDMQTDFWDGDGAQKSRYLPAGIMPKALVDWLDKSIVSGHIKSGSMLLYGPLQAFPYAHDEGRFEVLFDIERMVLDYMPSWPHLDEVVGRAHFLNNSLQVKLFEGRMLDSRLQQAEAQIRQLSAASPVEIRGELSGPVTDLFRILNETPLHSRFRRFTQEVAGAGRARTHLDLSIPLKHDGNWKTSGKVDFRKASLLIKEQDLKIENLTGELEFDGNRVWAERLRGEFLDHPVDFQVAPITTSGDAATRIAAQLRIPDDWLHSRVPSLGVLKGDVSAQVALDIAHSPLKTPVSLSIRSDLQGTAVELPAPLGKAVDESRELKVTIGFQHEHKSVLNIEYAQLIQAWLQGKDHEIDRGMLRLGQGGVEPVDKPGFHLLGQARYLNLDQWLGWLAQHEGGLDATTRVPLDVDLQVEHLILAGVHAADVKIEATQGMSGWQARFDSDELNGTFILPVDLDRLPIAIHLNRLKLRSTNLVSDGDKSSGKRKERRSREPGSIPMLNLKIDELMLDEQSLGQVWVKWRRAPLGIQLTELAIEGDLLNLHGQGFWHLVGAKHNTHLVLKGDIASLGQLQKAFELQFGITEAPMSFSAELDWPLPPYALNLEELKGDLKVRIDEGQITEVEPGMGRLVGLLSLHALGKRLLLDFSDLFAKGLKFDHIEGDFELADGNATTSDLKVVGPAVDIEVMGRTGLIARDYDQMIVVTPRVSSTLPIVGALAVNPTVGVVLAVAQQLMGKHMDRMTRTEYQLSGSWENPVIEESGKGKVVPQQNLSEELLDLD